MGLKGPVGGGDVGVRTPESLRLGREVGFTVTETTPPPPELRLESSTPLF